MYEALMLGCCCHGVAFRENVNGGLCSKSLGRPPFVILALFLPPDGLFVHPLVLKAKEFFCLPQDATHLRRTHRHYINKSFF